jgi:hypothetical protein
VRGRLANCALRTSRAHRAFLAHFGKKDSCPIRVFKGLADTRAVVVSEGQYAGLGAVRHADLQDGRLRQHSEETAAGLSHHHFQRLHSEGERNGRVHEGWTCPRALRTARRRSRWTSRRAFTGSCSRLATGHGAAELERGAFARTAYRTPGRAEVILDRDMGRDEACAFWDGVLDHTRIAAIIPSTDPAYVRGRCPSVGET